MMSTSFHGGKIWLSMELADCIANRIAQQGQVPFHDFMEWCLYDPDLGYYTSKFNPITINGDFYTSPMLTPVSLDLTIVLLLQ